MRGFIFLRLRATLRRIPFTLQESRWRAFLGDSLWRLSPVQHLSNAPAEISATRDSTVLVDASKQNPPQKQTHGSCVSIMSCTLKPCRARVEGSHNCKNVNPARNSAKAFRLFPLWQIRSAGFQSSRCFHTRPLPDMRSEGKSLSTAAGVESQQLQAKTERASVEYDVVIVGAGPAGLAAAIRLKQMGSAGGRDLSVCVIEKGAEVGAHILSGNIFETRALDELLPSWRHLEAPINVPVAKEKFLFLTEKRSLALPPPSPNHGNFVVSLSEVVRWMGSQAEMLGVEIYPGFAAHEVLYDGEGEGVVGVATNDVGIARDGSRKETFQPGMELRGRVTLMAEGCRGSLSEKIITRFRLREKAGAQHQTYALGIKEVWEVESGRHRQGEVWHTVGFPLPHDMYGGAFLYHMAQNQVALGLVAALDYRNPYVSPYQELQRWKLHPAIRPLLEGGQVVQYGARCLNEGGLQSVPELVFPGGALIGCSAGFLNVPKIKGTHTAMKSGMLAAEAAYHALTQQSEQATRPGQVSLGEYPAALRASWVWQELSRARNIRPGFKRGFVLGLANAALEQYVTRGRSPWTLKHAEPDHLATQPAAGFTPIVYPKPDGAISFDILTSLYRSNTNHEHDQPCHLLLQDARVPTAVNLPVFGGPEGRYCPAKVYEYAADGEEGTKELHINAQNCLHCKACDIKDPAQNIKWTAPEGGGGPGYSVM